MAEIISKFQKGDIIYCTYDGYCYYLITSNMKYNSDLYDAYNLDKNYSLTIGWTLVRFSDLVTDILREDNGI